VSPMFSDSTSYWLNSVHADVHRIGEVGIGAFLLVQDDLVHLVVGLEHDFGAEVVQQALELHAHGGGVAAAAAVFGLEHDHRVFAMHDHVAGADFLSDFHKGFPVSAGLQVASRADNTAFGSRAAVKCCKDCGPLEARNFRKALF
jgi:hypothetical protein